jgi:O-antigen/teichoic acid export membrane protein
MSNKDIQETLHHIVKDSLAYLPSYIVPAVCGLLSVTIFTRLLSVHDYSQYTMIFTTVTFVANICFAWLAFSGLRFFDESKTDLESFLSTSLTVLLVLILCIALLGFIVLFILTRCCPVKEMGAGFLGGILLLSAKSLFDLLLIFMRADRQVFRYSAFRVIESIAKLVLGIFFVYCFNLRYSGVIYGMVLPFLGLAIYEFLSSEIYKSTKLKLFSRTILHRLFRYGLPLIGAGVTGTVLSLSDRYLIAYFCEYNHVGLYAAGYRFAEMLIDAPASVLVLAYTPIIIKVFNRGGGMDIGEKLSQSLRMIFVVLIPTTVGSIVLSKELVGIFLDRQYHDVSRLFLWICTGMFFVSVNHLYTRIFELKNKTKMVFAISGTAALGNLLLNVLLIPVCGYVGAAIATFASYLLQCMISYKLSDGLIRVPIPYRTLFNALIGSGVMYLCITVLQKILVWNQLGNLLVNIGAGFASYMLTVLLLRDATVFDIIKAYTERRKPNAAA